MTVRSVDGGGFSLCSAQCAGGTSRQHALLQPTDVTMTWLAPASRKTAALSGVMPPPTCMPPETPHAQIRRDQIRWGSEQRRGGRHHCTAASMHADCR